MQYRDRIVSFLPELRRFTGALIAPAHAHSTGPVDELVIRAAAAVFRERPESDAAIQLALYSAIVRLAQSRDLRPSSAPQSAQSGPSSFADGLLSLQFQHRAALLLVTLERLTYEQAADVLGVSRAFLVAKVSTARQLLARRLETSGERPATHLRLVK